MLLLTTFGSSSGLPTSDNSDNTLFTFSKANLGFKNSLPLSFRLNLTLLFSAKNSLALVTLCIRSPSPIVEDSLSSFSSLFLDLALAADSFFLSSYKNLLKSSILATGGFASSAIKTKSLSNSAAFCFASSSEIRPKFSPVGPITLRVGTLILSLIL